MFEKIGRSCRSFGNLWNAGKVSFRDSLDIAGCVRGRVEGAMEAAVLEVLHACSDIRINGAPLRRTVLIGGARQCAAFILKPLQPLAENSAQAAIGLLCQTPNVQQRVPLSTTLRAG